MSDGLKEKRAMGGILKINAGQKVAIAGLGISGKSAVKYCLKKGAEVFVSDIREQQKFLLEEGDFLRENKVEWEAGGHSFDFLSRAEMIIPSPGVDLAVPLFEKLRTKGCVIAGELAFAGSVQRPVVAITGTNGKTTVTTLTGQLLQEAGKKVFVGGNIGISLFDYLLEPEGYDILVLEVSSFQLESGGDFAPDVAVLLNVSPDHLDRHGSFEHYLQAKMNIFIHQDKGDTAIVNGDCPDCMKIPATCGANKVLFGRKAEHTIRISGKNIIFPFQGEDERYSLRNSSLGDETGLYNCCPAIFAARITGSSPVQVQRGLDTFAPLEHRMELVAEVDGIRFFNDSKATNTGAVIAALEQMKQKSTVLILGGRDKGDDYSLLTVAVAEKVKAVVLIGEAAPLIRSALGSEVVSTKAASMEDAVNKALEYAESGDVVLLSPACASFDMFESYGQRGRLFKKTVLALAGISEQEQK